MAVDPVRIAEIAFHSYNIDAGRMGAAGSLRKPAARGRFMLDEDGTRTKIRRSPDMETLIRGYVARRVVVAARLMQLFAQLTVELESRRRRLLWALEIRGAVVQLTRSVGSDGYTHAAHTAPGQIYIDGQLPWNLTTNSSLKSEFVRWFADIFVVPLLVNETDSYLDSPSQDVLNRNLFITALRTVVVERTEPLAAHTVYCRALVRRIASSTEYQRFAPAAPDWVLGLYLDEFRRSSDWVRPLLKEPTLS